jgi:ADP-ribosylation factor related protein 1
MRFFFFFFFFHRPDCMGVREVKPVFASSAQQIGNRDCLVMPVCALTGDGVDEGSRWLVQCIKQNTAARPPRERDA